MPSHWISFHRIHPDCQRHSQIRRFRYYLPLRGSYLVADPRKKDLIDLDEDTTDAEVSDASVEVPNLTWNGIDGLDGALQYLVQHPKKFIKYVVSPFKGVHLHGLPGTGKTLLAKAIVIGCQAKFISINCTWKPIFVTYSTRQLHSVLYSSMNYVPSPRLVVKLRAMPVTLRVTVSRTRTIPRRRSQPISPSAPGPTLHYTRLYDTTEVFPFHVDVDGLSYTVEGETEEGGARQ
jgi:hypothetical protein